MSNKFCQECGHKNVPINGKTARFCSNCGTPLDPSAKMQASAPVADEPAEQSSFKIQASDLLEIQSGPSDFISMKFEDIANGQKSSGGLKRPRGSQTSVDAVLNNIKNYTEKMGDE